MKINFCPPPKKNPSSLSFQNVNDISKREVPTVDFVCFWFQGWNQQHQKQHTAGDQGRARDSNYPQVRPACWDSLGARWPHCQQAEPRLIKDVEPNWSYQHLLSLHLGGWRQSPARCAHKPSDLEMREILEDQRLQMKKVKGMNQNWKKKKVQVTQKTLQECHECLTSNGPYTLRA